MITAHEEPESEAERISWILINACENKNWKYPTQVARVRGDIKNLWPIAEQTWAMWQRLA